MKLKRRHSFTAEVATSSLNDIMFFLLLFFLIISTMSNPNVIKLLLPSSNAGGNVAPKQIQLSVTDDKKFFIEKREIPTDALESELIKLTKEMQQPTIVLRFSRSLIIQDLVDVLEIGSRNNIKMILATSKRTG